MTLAKRIEKLEQASAKSNFEKMLVESEVLLSVDPRNVNWMHFKYRALCGLNRLSNEVGFLRKYCFYNSFDTEAFFHLHNIYKLNNNIEEALIAAAFSLSCPNPCVQSKIALKQQLSNMGVSSLKLIFLHAHRIGHLGLEPDVWLRQLNLNKEKGVLYLFVSGGEYANTCLKEMVVNGLNIENVIIVDSPYWFNFHQTRPKLLDEKYYQAMPMDINSLKRSRDINKMYGYALNAYQASASVLTFPKARVTAVEARLAKKGLVNLDKVVCYHVRDSEYLKNTQPGMDFSYHESRNMNIDNYRPAIEALLEKGYTVVRLGKFSNQRLDLQHARYYDFCRERDDENGDDIDMYLFSICQFFIGNNSGMVYASSVFDTPTLAVNMIPFFPLAGRNTRFIPKLLVTKSSEKVKFIDILQGREFNYKGNRVKMLEHHSHSCDFEADGIYSIENDARDIKEAVEEFSKLVNHRVLDESKTERQQRYIQSIPEDVWFKTSDCVVSDSFLTRYSELFDL